MTAPGALAALVRACVLAPPALAQRPAAGDYPARPVRLIVPFPAGGGVDGVARIVAQRMAERFGQQVVIDDRGGSGGVIAAELAARSAG